MADVYTVRSASLPDSTRVIGFRGTEALSRPYVFEVFLQINGPEAHDIDLADAVGAKAAIVASRDDDRPPFVFSGIFSEVSLLHEIEERAVVRAVLVPQLWRLSQTFHSCIYTQLSITQIIEAVLQDGGLTSDDYVLRLSGQYKPEEHVCQYRESHLDFISRWMEREGLYYFFEHAEEGEKLVITDSKSFHNDLAPSPIRYFPQSGKDNSAGEHLQTFACKYRQLPASVRFKDHDYNKPTLDVSGSAAVSKTGLGEISLHGSRLFTPDAAKRMATLRAETLQSRERLFTASGTALYLRSGCTFSLTDHPRSAFDTSYLTIEVEHHANQLAGSRDLRDLTGLDSDEVYRVDVTAIPANIQFRAEEKTAWPRIYGTEPGVIDGEADSEYAQIDDHGRYSVRFAFDESDLKDGKASTWVRMMQPHGGGVEGWHFPLRKGTEVLFTFLGGDPDRPVIAGVVPNALKPSPVTRANHTKNVIQTGGRNRVEMEDKEGYERITISTPHQDSYIRFGAPNDHEMIVHTNGATLLDAGQDLDVVVGVNKHETVNGTTTEHYLSAKQEMVKGTATEHFLSSKDVLVTGALKEQHSALHQITVSGGRDETYSTQKTLVQGDRSETVGGGVTTTIGSNWVQNIGGHVHLSTNGSGSWFTGGLSTKVHLGLDTNASLGGKLSSVVGGRLQVIAGIRLDVNLGVRIDANCGVYVQYNSSPAIQLSPLRMASSSLMLHKAATRIAIAANALANNGLRVECNGSTLFG